MKMSIIFTSLLLGIAATSCGDGIDLPPIPAETDIYKITLPSQEANIEVEAKDESVPMIHNGGLHTPEDYAYVKSHLNEQPFKFRYGQLMEQVDLEYKARPAEVIYREHATYGNNYLIAQHDGDMAYHLALAYHLTGDERYGDKAIEIVNAWAHTCNGVDGNSNAALAYSSHGYAFANVGEMMRERWQEKSPEDFANFQSWLLRVFYPRICGFIDEHTGTSHWDHYWPNWFLLNYLAKMSIGIACDRRDIYNDALIGFQTEKNTGNINNAIYHIYADQDLAQWTESGRDQGHTTLCQGVMGMIMQLAWNQGDNLFAYNDNVYCKAGEYAARQFYTKVGVPFTTYTKLYNGNIETYAEAAPSADGKASPTYILIYKHYKVVSPLANFTTRFPNLCIAAKAAGLQEGIAGAKGGGAHDTDFGPFSIGGALMWAVAE